MMKKIILIVIVQILIIGNIKGQTDSLRSEQLRVKFWNNRSSDWNTTEVPEKWSSESAVILNKETYYWVKKAPVFASLEEKYHSHSRIKILDDNAINTYSEFSFEESQSYYNLFWGTSNLHYYYGIKIIKPDGSEHIVGESEKVRSEVEYRNTRRGHEKIAIPNLEIGDVIDYYYCMERRFPMDQFFVFDPVRYFLNDNYPIVRQELRLEIARKCYLNCKSINGAPQMKELQSDDEKVVTFQMHDEDREKFELEYWSFPYAELPCIKFQAFFPGTAFSYPVPYADFLGVKSKMKDTANPRGLAKMANLVNTAGAGTFYPRLKKYILSKYGKNKPDDVEGLVNDVYFFLREYWCQQQFFVKNQRTNFYSWFSMYSTVGGISRILKMYKIEHDLLYVMPKYIGTTEDLLFLDELALGLHVKGQDKPLLITKMNPYSIPGELPEVFSGVKAFAVPALKETPIVSSYIIPNEVDESEECVSSRLKFEPGSESFQIESDFVINGASKLKWDTIVLTNSVFKDEFNTQEYEKFIKDKSKKKNLEEYRSFYEKMELRLSEEKKEKLVKLEQYLKEYLGIQNCKIHDLKIVSSGRWSDSPELKFQVKWESSSFVTQLGDKSLVKVGSFMKRPEIAELLKEDRLLDIHFRNREKIVHKLEIDLPEGYEVKGLEDLEAAWEDSDFYTKGFGKLVDNAIAIELEAGIKNPHLSLEKWENVKRFFTEVTSLYNKQIVLQKI